MVVSSLQGTLVCTCSGAWSLMLMLCIAEKRQPFAESDSNNFLEIVYAVLKIKKLMTDTHGHCASPKCHAGFWEILSSQAVLHRVFSSVRVLLMPGNQRNADHLC